MSDFQSAATIDELLGCVGKHRFVLLSAFGAGCSICLQPAAQARIARSYSGAIGLLEVDVDTVPDVDAAIGIDTIPTLLLFREGSVKSKFRVLPDADGGNVMRWLGGELRGEVAPVSAAARKPVRKRAR